MLNILDFFKKIRKKNNDLVILDDMYPNILSAFRITEYNYYLNKYKNMEIYSWNSDFAILYDEFVTKFPEFKNRSIYSKKTRSEFSAKLFYTIFINNIYSSLEIIERSKLPFIFTLYPGGGFGINNIESDEKLKKVFASKYFREVIVTQNISYKYLLNNNLCPKEQIEYIYGGVLSKASVNKDIDESKKYYQYNKKTFDICFCAAKYIDKGIDKGYDVFIDIVKKLTKIPNVFFHVIGGFGKHDIDVSGLEDKIRFYGYKNTDEMHKIYKNMDIIISPNRPFVLGKGYFDGFLTGCCAEASLNGVAVFCTDYLKLNQDVFTGVAIYEDEVDIVIISEDIQDCIEKIYDYYLHPDRLRSLANNGFNRTCELLNEDIQMRKRTNILDGYL